MGHSSSVQVNVLNAEAINGLDIDPCIKRELGERLKDRSIPMDLVKKAEKQLQLHKDKFGWTEADVQPASAVSVYAAAVAAVRSSKKLSALPEQTQDDLITYLVSLIVRNASSSLEAGDRALLKLNVFGNSDAVLSLVKESKSVAVQAREARVARASKKCDKKIKESFAMRKALPDMPLRVKEVVEAHPQVAAGVSLSDTQRQLLERVTGGDAACNLRSVAEQDAALKGLEVRAERLQHERNELARLNEELRRQLTDARAVRAVAPVSSVVSPVVPAVVIPAALTSPRGSSGSRRPARLGVKAGNIHGIQE